MPRGERIDAALATLEENAHRETDGRWLEDLIADVAPHIRDWNVDACRRWRTCVGSLCATVPSNA